MPNAENSPHLESFHNFPEYTFFLPICLQMSLLVASLLKNTQHSPEDQPGCCQMNLGKNHHTTAQKHYFYHYLIFYQSKKKFSTKITTKKRKHSDYILLSKHNTNNRAISSNHRYNTDL